MYYLYCPVLHYSLDLCATYLDYSPDLTQALRALAEPAELVEYTASRLQLPLRTQWWSSHYEVFY